MFQRSCSLKKTFKREKKIYEAIVFREINFQVNIQKMKHNYIMIKWI